MAEDEAREIRLNALRNFAQTLEQKLHWIFGHPHYTIWKREISVSLHVAIVLAAETILIQLSIVPVCRQIWQLGIIFFNFNLIFLVEFK